MEINFDDNENDSYTEDYSKNNQYNLHIFFEKVGKKRNKQIKSKSNIN